MLLEKNDVRRLTRCRVATNLQFVKKKKSKSGVLLCHSGLGSSVVTAVAWVAAVAQVQPDPVESFCVLWAWPKKKIQHLQ